MAFAATRTSRVLRIDSGGAGFAGITRLLRAKTQVAVKAHVNLKRDGLKPGASRPIVWVGGDGGHSQQAGVIRTAAGCAGGPGGSPPPASGWTWP